MIKEIIIKSLWGSKDIFIRIKNNTLIIIGENGTGKSTILRIIYEFLSCKWIDLSIENFESITVHFEDQSISVSKNDLKNLDSLFIEISDPLFQDLPPSIKRKLTERKTLTSDSLSYYELLEALRDYQRTNIYEKIKKRIEENINKSLKNKQKIIESNLDATILYLPTYRRIEKSLLNDYDESGYSNRRFMSKRYSNVSSFEISSSGMSDVKSILNDILYDIYTESNELSVKLNIDFLRDILSKEYTNKKYHQIGNYGDVNNILTKYSNTILNADEIDNFKRKIINLNLETEMNDDLVISYLFYKFKERYEKLLKKEEELSNTIKLINEYLFNKEIIYNLQTIDFRVKIKNSSNNVELINLSSGEKQILSIFTHIYLGWPSKVLVLIDEPELSLSVEWQERFLLDIKNGRNLIGLFAVTHSPYIFNNNLSKYVQSVEDFYNE